MNQPDRGFTLIELMVVIAILAVMLVIAIVAYRDYTIRTKVSEGIYAAGPAKIAVVETFHSSGAVPDQAATGYQGYESKYVKSIEILDDTSGTIVITTRATGGSPDPVLRLSPDFNADATAWECQYAAGQTRHIPAECRNEP
jgi:type IV pilus assembly protein PilA